MATGGNLPLRAVVFDFGMVLSGQPNMEAHAAMVKITGLPVDQFETLYWADRLAYDQGTLSGLHFWQNFVRDAGLKVGESAVEELHRLDALYWTTQNPAILAWQAQLKKRGLLTGILSNMGDSVLASIEKHFDWLPRFDVLVWSFQLGMVKPDPAIYHHLLSKLGTQPEETLFLDDRHANVEAARALGIRAIEFTTIEKLRGDLIAAGFDRELPLPC
jgi:putative hydrolase of the HAD superfamily